MNTIALLPSLFSKMFTGSWVLVMSAGRVYHWKLTGCLTDHCMPATSLRPMNIYVGQEIESETGVVVDFVAVADDRELKGPAGAEGGMRASRRAGSRQAVRGKP